MASILDAGLASLFSAIFVFLLVYAISYGVLSWRKPFGDNKGSYAIVSLCIAFLMSIAPPARVFVTFVAPWYIAFGIAIFFILFLVMLFGKEAKDLTKIIDDQNAQAWFIIICVIIAIAGLAAVFGQSTLSQQGGDLPAPVDTNGDGIADSGYGTVGVEPGTPGSTATSDFGTNLLNTLIHPKVLGLAVTFLIASISIYFLSKG